MESLIPHEVVKILGESFPIALFSALFTWCAFQQATIYRMNARLHHVQTLAALARQAIQFKTGHDIYESIEPPQIDIGDPN